MFSSDDDSASMFVLWCHFLGLLQGAACAALGYFLLPLPRVEAHTGVSPIVRATPSRSFMTLGLANSIILFCCFPAMRFTSNVLPRKERKKMLCFVSFFCCYCRVLLIVERPNLYFELNVSQFLNVYVFVLPEN